LIDYEIQTNTQSSGLIVNSGHLSPGFVALGACLFATIAGQLIAKSKLPNRLIAMTESPVQYRLLLGSRTVLALQIELLAFLTYFLAGVALFTAVSDLSADEFGTESIWCVLAAAPMARTSGFAVLAGPILATVIRVLIGSFVPARLAQLFVYLALALLLTFVARHAKEASRDAAA